MKHRFLHLYISFRNALSTMKRPAIYSLGITTFFILQLLISPIGMKIDLSEGKAYSLSPATKKILKQISKPLTVKLFISSDLPPRLTPVKSDILDLVNEYKREKPTRITISVVDPKKDKKILEEAQKLGIQELQFSQLEKDKYQVATAYLGMGMYSGEKQMSIPQLTDLSNLEYNISSLVTKLTQKTRAKIGIIGDTQLTTGQESAYSAIGSLLFKEYEISPIDLSSISEQKIDTSYQAIILLDNRSSSYSSEQIKLLNDYSVNGGKLIVFADGVWVQNSLTADVASHNLFSLFKNWGVTLEKNLVLSASAELINFGNESQQFINLYYFWFRTNNFPLKTGPLSNIESVTFPWGSSVTVAKKPGITSRILVQSSPQSWVQTSSFQLNPQEIPLPTEKDLKTYPIVVQLTHKKNGELTLIPSSRFVEDRFLSRSSENIELVFNLIDNAVSGGMLSGIRSRSVQFHQLPPIPENQKDIFKYAMMFLLPLLFAIAGSVRLIRRG